MPQLDPTWFASQLFWLAVTFVALYLFLSRMVLPPLTDIILKRKEVMDHDLAQAQELKSEAEQARFAYERMMAEARSKAQQLVSDAMLAHKASAEQQARELDKQIEQKLADAAKKIAARKSELLQALTPTTSDLTAMIVEKLTRHKPGSEQVSRIIDDLAKGRN